MKVLPPTMASKIYLNFYQRITNLEAADDTIMDYLGWCKQFDNGPFDVQLCPVSDLLNELNNDFVCNHNQATIESCKEAALILAKCLIGDTKATLHNFINQCLSSGNLLLPFYVRTFGQLPKTLQYKAYYKNLKGSIILAVMREVLQEDRFLRDSEARDYGFKLLMNLTLNRSKTSPLIPTTELLPEVLSNIAKKDDRLSTWITFLTNFLQKADKRLEVFKWDNGATDFHNPTNFAVALLNIVSTMKGQSEVIERLFKILGNFYRACDIQLNNCKPFYLITNLDWTLKYIVMSHLQVKGYKKEIPAAIHNVLSEQEKEKYTCIDDAQTCLLNYLTAIFELALRDADIEDAFLENAGEYFDNVHIDVQIAKGFRLAFMNHSLFEKPVITPKVMNVLQRVFTAFDGVVDTQRIESFTQHVWQTLYSMQSYVLLGKTIREAIYHHSEQDYHGELPLDYNKLPQYVKNLFPFYCEHLNKILNSYRDKCQKAVKLSDETQPLSRSDQLAIPVVITHLHISLNSLAAELTYHPVELDILKKNLGLLGRDFLQLFPTDFQLEFLPDVPEESSSSTTSHERDIP